MVSAQALWYDPVVISPQVHFAMGLFPPSVVCSEGDIPLTDSPESLVLCFWSRGSDSLVFYGKHRVYSAFTKTLVHTVSGDPVRSSLRAVGPVFELVEVDVSASSNFSVGSNASATISSPQAACSSTTP